MNPISIWRDAMERQRTVWQAAFPSEAPRPRWATENRCEEVSPTVSLRTFLGDAAAFGGRPPVLIITPQVNHSYIADFSPRQSLVRTLLAAGAPRVAVTDWAAPARDGAYGIADSLDDVGACAERLGGPVHLVGLCQGGWQSAIWTALHPARVASLAVAAAPIDTHAGQTALHAFTLGLPMAFFENLVRLGGGTVPGAMLAQGFDLLKPYERFFGAYASLYLKAHDPDAVERYAELRNWYRLNKDVAGKIYLEVVRQLFQENRLARGTLTIRGERVDLGAIRCPLHLVAGRRDHITPPPQVFALEKLAPQAPTQRYEVDAGHIGVFMGTKALETVWPAIAATWQASA